MEEISQNRVENVQCELPDPKSTITNVTNHPESHHELVSVAQFSRRAFLRDTEVIWPVFTVFTPLCLCHMTSCLFLLGGGGGGRKLNRSASVDIKSLFGSVSGELLMKALDASETVSVASSNMFTGAVQRIRASDKSLLKYKLLKRFKSSSETKIWRT